MNELITQAEANICRKRLIVLEACLNEIIRVVDMYKESAAIKTVRQLAQGAMLVSQDFQKSETSE